MLCSEKFEKGQKGLVGMKKYVFIAHEFGLYKGHGGIASYLYSIVKYILKNNLAKVWVLTIMYDTECDLLPDPNLTVDKISDENDVVKKLAEIQADYVEVADYQGFALAALIKKHSEKSFKTSVFAVHHHTASRECFVWNAEFPLEFAAPHVRDTFMRETTQMMLADMHISPSKFLAEYVKQNYEIADDIVVLPHYNEIPMKTHADIIKEIKPYNDISQYADSFNIVFISRIEGRKNQLYLVLEFEDFLRKSNIPAKLILAGNSYPFELTGEDTRFLLFKQIPEAVRNNIIIFDFMDRKQQKLLAAVSDVCVLPSKFENFPMAIAEMLSYGVPVLASKNSGAADYVQREMTFDPFQKGALSAKLFDFYKRHISEREEIWREQTETFKKITDPKNVIVKRLEIFENLRQADQEPICIKWNLINENQWNEKSYAFDSGDFILTTNILNDTAALRFAENFTWNKNMDNKLVVLSNQYEYLSSVQDVVNRGLPIFYRGVNILEFDRKKTLYQNLLDVMIKEQRQIVALKWKGISCQMDKRFTDYVFINRSKIDLAELYKDGYDEQ